MRALNYYFKALQFCDALEQYGMASIRMPESNIFISQKLTGEDRRLALDAISVYVRVHKALRRITIAIQIISFVVVGKIAYSLFA